MRPIRNLEMFNRPLGKFLTNKIHYGCGKKIFKGWLNVDGYDESYPDGSIDPGIAENIFYCDLTQKHPFPLDYFEFGFCEDFLEHLDQGDSLIFLEEVYRTFCTGGVLRLSFPGFEGVLKRHFNNRGFEEFRLGQKDAYATWMHKHFYCKDSLKLVARHIGFGRIEFVEYGVSRYLIFNNLDSRPDQVDLNIYVELTK